MEPHDYGAMSFANCFPKYTSILYQAGMFYKCSANTIEGHAGRKGKTISRIYTDSNQDEMLVILGLKGTCHKENDRSL